MSRMQPTAEQEQIIAMARRGGSMKVNAFAGTGKTTTLGFLADAHPAARVLYLAFNRDIANDAGGKMGRKVESRTMHSAAYAATRPDRARLEAKMSGRWVADKFSLSEVMMAGKRITLATMGSMVLQTLSRYCNSADESLSIWHVPGLSVVYENVPDDVSGDKHAWAMVDSQVLAAAKKLWAMQQDANSDVPITHDTYLKQWALRAPQIKTDLIMFDEAQDASPVIIDLLAKQAAPVVWVGDRHQQIYAWRGAVDALSKVRVDSEGYLTQSFRFGSNVADIASGLLQYLGEEKPLSGVGGGNDDGADAVLSRTNAQAIANFMDLKGRANLSGARELSNTLDQLRDLMNGRPHGAFALFSDYDELAEYANSGSGRELKAVLRAINDYGLDVITDKVRESQRLAKDAYKITVSTCHKAKGREWGRVYITADWKRDEDGDPVLTDEEARLMYVAVTRAKCNLDVEDIRPWLDLANGITPESHQVMMDDDDAPGPR